MSSRIGFLVIQVQVQVVVGVGTFLTNPRRTFLGPLGFLSLKNLPSLKTLELNFDKKSPRS